MSIRSNTNNPLTLASVLLLFTSAVVAGTPPKANAGPDKTVQVNNPITISGSGSDSGGSIVRYQWKRTDDNSVVSNSKSFSITPSGTRAKTFVLKVTDNEGKTASDTMVLSVTKDPVESGNQGGTTSPTNTPPTADAGPDKIVQVNHTITISGSGSDSDGSIVKYTWKKQGEDRILSNSESLDFTPSGTRPKILVLSVTDDEGKTASDTMTLTVTKDSVTGNTPPTSASVAGSNSPYLEPVNLPKCDPYNPEVQFIETNADWKTINNGNKRIFCVSPGDYTSLNSIKLTASGTSKKKRYILLNNENNLHPGKLSDEQLAFYALTLNNADYWVIDRGAFKRNSRAYSFMYGSSYNILNRAYVRNFGNAVLITANSHNNTIQKCRLQDQTHKSRLNDTMAILLEDKPYGSPFVEIKNTKIIANETKNCNDGLHIARHPRGEGRQEGNMEGTIIDGNHMYITSDIYTDGNGKYTSNGKHAYAENAIDIKIGSDNPNNPIIVSNNHFWGYRKTDITDSNIKDNGFAVVFHFGVKNVIMNDNVIFDSAGGIISTDKRDQPYAMENVTLKRNLIYSCGKIANVGTSTGSLAFSRSANIRVTDNDIINGREYIAKMYYNSKEVCVGNNIIINSMDKIFDYEGNKNDMQTCSNTNKIYNTASNAGYTKDYKFTTDNFTNKSRQIILNNAVKTN